MNSLDRILALAAVELERRAVPSGPPTLKQALDALGELGRGLSAAVDVLDGRPTDYTPGPALAWFVQGTGGRSLLGDLARALCGAPNGGAPP